MQDNKLTRDLVRNAQFGNNSAFQQLYQITIEQIYSLTRRLSEDSTSAEMLTKKVYVNAWHKISQKDEFTSIASWIKKITVETIFQETNAFKKGERKDADKNFSADPFENHIRNLEFRKRLVYVLHDIEKFSLEEISNLTGIDAAELKMLLIRARETLINFI